MRFHEALLCVAAMLAPIIAVAVWTIWWVPLAVLLGFSVPVVCFAGWLVDG